MNSFSLRLSAAAVLAAAVALLLPTVTLAQTPGRSFRGAYELTPAGSPQQVVLFVGKNSFAYCIYADYANRSVGVANFSIGSAGQFSFTTNNGRSVAGTFTESGVTGNTNFGAFSAGRQFLRGVSAQSAGCYNGWIYDSSRGSINSITWIIVPNGRLYVASYNGNNVPVDGGTGTSQVDGTPSGRGVNFSFSFASVLDGFGFTGVTNLTEGVLAGSFSVNGSSLFFSMPRENASYHLINLSTRGFVNTGDGVLIGGFVISGGAKRVVVRALGPSLSGSVAGTLADPNLQVNAGSAVLTTNDNWRTDANSSQISALGLAPTSDLESAVILNLEPGNYTAIVRGSGNATGIALVEVYEVD